MTTYRFAGFWRRLAAYMIDGFIISAIFTVLMIIATVSYVTGALSSDGGALMSKITDPAQMTSLSMSVWAFSSVLNIAYFTCFHGATGRTPGKRVMGLQVISVEGTRISYGTAFLRTVGYLVSSLVFCLGYTWIGFDKKKQGWHDKIAGTVVIVRDIPAGGAGITIPAGVDRTQTPAGVDQSSTDFMPAEIKTPPAHSGVGDAGEDVQKIP